MSDAIVVVSDEGLGGIPAFAAGITRRGLTPFLLTGPAPAKLITQWQTLYEDVRVVDDPYDPAQLVEAARTVAGEHRIAALFSCYDGLVLPSAQAAAALGLAHPNESGIAQSRNKLATRLATKRNGLPTPRFAATRSADDCVKAASEVGFPAVIKPLNGTASHLVRRVESSAELDAAYKEILARLPLAFARNYKHVPAIDGKGRPEQKIDGLRTLLLEEHLEGQEYSAEIVVRDGVASRVALFHKFLVDKRGFLECGFTRPAFTDRQRCELVWQHIEECLAALGVDNAAAHVEVIDTADGPRLVEVNAGRPGGQIIVLAVREATGIDLIDEIVALQLGQPRPPPGQKKLEGRVSTLTVFPPGSGRLDALDGLDRLEELPGVVRVLSFCAPGDLLEIDDKEFFAVNLLVEGGDEAELRALYAKACETVTFHVSPLMRNTKQAI